MSNALRKSMKTAPVICPLLRDLRMYSVKNSCAESVERADRKPNCALLRRLLVSRCAISCFESIFSKSLDSVGRIDMGR